MDRENQPFKLNSKLIEAIEKYFKILDHYYYRTIPTFIIETRDQDNKEKFKFQPVTKA